MKCPLCGHELINNKCTRFPICRFVLKENNINQEDFTYVMFDLETTGFNKNKDRITEIGAIKVKGEEIIDEFSMLVNPGNDEFGNKIFISPRISSLTGITNEMVKDKKHENEAVTEFINWIGDIKVLGGQNIKTFDIPFLKSAAKRAGMKLDCDKAIDTLYIAKNLKLKEKGLIEKYNQTALAEYYGFTYNAHRALDDVKACFKILNYMKKEIDIRPEPLKKS